MTESAQPSDPSGRVRPTISVRALLADPDLGLKVDVLAGDAGLERLIRHSRIQKSGLALVGHFHGIVPSRIQIFGQTELSFLQGLSVETPARALRDISDTRRHWRPPFIGHDSVKVPRRLDRFTRSP